MNTKTTIKGSFLVVFILFVFKGFSQKSETFPTPEIPVEIKATKTTKKIKIDGILSENDWKNAQTITEFYKVEPKQGGSYLYKNEVKSGFYQYNDFTETGRVNARFSWEYLPQSFVYLVFNNTETDVFNPVQIQNQFISKITFVKQF